MTLAARTGLLFASLTTVKCRFDAAGQPDFLSLASAGMTAAKRTENTEQVDQTSHVDIVGRRSFGLQLPCTGSVRFRTSIETADQSGLELSRRARRGSLRRGHSSSVCLRRTGRLPHLPKQDDGYPARRSNVPSSPRSHWYRPRSSSRSGRYFCISACAAVMRSAVMGCVENIFAILLCFCFSCDLSRSKNWTNA